MIKALMIMIIRRLYTAAALLAFLQQDDPVVKQLCGLLNENGRISLTDVPGKGGSPNCHRKLPEMIGYFGRHLVVLLDPWKSQGRAASLDSTPLRTGGTACGTKTVKMGRFRTLRSTLKSRMEQIRLAGGVVRLEAPLGGRCRLGLDSIGRRATATNVGDSTRSPPN
ncbi:MAG: hypothetical protein KIT57_04835 [Blastocatellales bacterium]|nr:hypothetical protein [Blastocatellales bacterium]